MPTSAPKIVSLSADILADLRKIAGSHGKLYVFGSRAKNSHRKFSDIDLCIVSDRPIPDLVMAEIKERFQESGIPFKVDVVDYHSVSDDFRRLISSHWVAI
jgi:uncharacterized protein